MKNPTALAIIVTTGVVISALVSLIVGLRQSKRMHALADLLPVRRGFQAEVRSTQEFSAATVAATISLATVVMAYFELASYMGVWLLWTVVTTSLGILIVRVASRRIWIKLRQYGSRIPTLHEFLGTEFDSKHLALVGAVATSLGYLGAFAVELTVGARLFGGLVPRVPLTAAVVCLAIVGLFYTAAGGFRAVIITDRIQMFAIWGLIIALSGFYLLVIARSGSAAFASIPRDTFTFSKRQGLVAFLIGIFIINVPTYLGDMGMWQRVSSSKDPSNTVNGLVRSAAGAGLSWGALAALAILAPLVTVSSSDVNPLIGVLRQLIVPISLVGIVVLLVSIVGLYAAMMSTSSTQLIAVSHTVIEDILSRNGGPSPSEAPRLALSVGKARLVILVAAGLSVAVVELLSRAGFTIADLVFAIYGSQLGLFPAVVVALYSDRQALRAMRHWAAFSVGLGFVAGWSSAIAGKLMGNSNLVFLAPAVSLAVSGGLLFPQLLRSGMTIGRRASGAT